MGYQKLQILVFDRLSESILEIPGCNAAVPRQQHFIDNDSIIEEIYF